MTNGIGTGQDPALEPAAAASRQSEASAAAVKKVQEAEAGGREAVKQVDGSGGTSGAPEPDKGHRVDRVA